MQFFVCHSEEVGPTQQAREGVSDGFSVLINRSGRKSCLRPCLLVFYYICLSCCPAI